MFRRRMRVMMLMIVVRVLLMVMVVDNVACPVMFRHRKVQGNVGEKRKE